MGGKFNTACDKRAHPALSYCYTENAESSCVGHVSIRVVNSTSCYFKTMIVYLTTQVLIISLMKADYVLEQHAYVLVSHWLTYFNTISVERLQEVVDGRG